MSDPQTPPSGNPSEGDKQTIQIDMTKFVPKEEYEKAIAEKDSSLQGLKKDLEDAQAKLLSPEFLDFLEDQKQKKGKDVKPPTDEELKDMKVPQSVIDTINSLNERVKNTETAMSNIAAVLELKDVESRYSDFNDFREDVQKILETPGSTLTIEQAYKLAKSEKGQGTEPPKDDKATKGVEKPGGTRPPANDTKRDFKSESEAANAAADEVWERHGITGDII